MPLKIKDFTLPQVTSTNLVNRFNELLGKNLTERDYQSFIDEFDFCFYAFHQDDIQHNYPLEKYNVADNENYYAGFKKDENNYIYVFRITSQNDAKGKPFFHDFIIIDGVTKETLLQDLFRNFPTSLTYQRDIDLTALLLDDKNHYADIMEYFDDILEIDLNDLEGDDLNHFTNKKTKVPFYKTYFD